MQCCDIPQQGNGSGSGASSTTLLLQHRHCQLCAVCLFLVLAIHGPRLELHATNRPPATAAAVAAFHFTLSKCLVPRYVGQQTIEGLGKAMDVLKAVSAFYRTVCSQLLIAYNP